MKKSLLMLIVLLSACSAVMAQTMPAPHGPPKVLYLVREDIKPGMMPAHNKHSANFATIFGQLQTPNYRIALVPVAGSENEVVYLTGAETFAQLEGMLQGTDKKMGAATGATKAELARLAVEAPQLHNAMRDMFAIYRPELSFNPGVVLPQMRYFSITTVRLKPGKDAEYAEYIQKVVNVARTKAKVDNFHAAVFQVISGTGGGTYLIFRPMKSLGEMDDPVNMRVRAAMSDDMRKEADKSYSDAVMSSETSTYWLTPEMSYVEKEFAAVDPTFWNTKPEPVAMKPKPRKRTAKPAVATPPAN
ncbi:MAG: hypothetical protein QOF62_798 [Pyrinomonadaceae bacterium]|jgi:hypothetical protein|nr:hypothetical protein [Pyrinomonadaceae bacterium]